jgi:lipopolysaccharide transport system permease protein
MNRTKTVIDPEHSGASYWKDLWAYRGLFRFLAWRDLLVRYKQTVIGVAWAVIRPLLTIVVFSKFGKVIGFDTHGIEMVLLVTAATLPWQLFSSALNESSNSLIANSNLITKVYFPRLIIPLSTIIVCLVDFLIAVAILIILMAYYGQAPSSHIVFLPLFLLLALLSSIGAGVFLSSLNVKYRDFRYVVPFVIQLGLFISPVAFSSEIVFNNTTTHVPELSKILYSLNPMVAVIDGFRWCLFGDDFPIDWRSVQISCASTFVILVFGIWYFRRVEKNFADII